MALTKAQLSALQEVRHQPRSRIADGLTTYGSEICQRVTEYPEVEPLLAWNVKSTREH